MLSVYNLKMSLVTPIFDYQNEHDKRQLFIMFNLKNSVEKVKSHLEIKKIQLCFNVLNFSLQDKLYHSIMQQVDTFRELLGMPDNERFNVVLFGGTCRTTYIYMARDSLVSVIIIIAKNTQQWFLI